MGEALLQEGKLNEAAKVLQSAGEATDRVWQQARAYNTQGRALHEAGYVDGALDKYHAAAPLNQYDVAPLSNAGAAYREKGGKEFLAKAQSVLEQAAKVKDDSLVQAMLQQVIQEQQQANDLRRTELIRNQINDLKARYEELKASGEATPVDPWSSRPMVVAFRAEPEKRAFFNRAGMDMVLQREVERIVNNDDRITVVERDMLDQLLQELNLGSSELASADTQRRLGRVLSASNLGFIGFSNVAGPMMHLRMVDSETTAIGQQETVAIDGGDVLTTAQQMADALVSKLMDGRELQGLIADASDAKAIMINLGARHGVREGQRYNILVEGEPVEVGGRVISTRHKPVGRLTVTTVEEDYALCEASNLKDGVALAKEMKIQMTH